MEERGGATKKAHTAHPRRNKVRGGAHTHKKNPTQERSHFTVHRPGKKVFPGLSKAAACYFSPGQIDCVCRSWTECWLLVVRWPHKGGRWSSAFGEPTRKDVCVETLQEGNCAMVTFAR